MHSGYGEKKTKKTLCQSQKYLSVRKVPSLIPQKYLQQLQKYNTIKLTVY